MVDDGSAVATEYTIQIGISLDPLAEVQNQLEQQRVQREQLGSAGASSGVGSSGAAGSSGGRVPPQDADSIASLANKIVQHAYNFLGGFADANGNVPMRRFDEWWAKFKTRLASNPKFLDSL